MYSIIYMYIKVYNICKYNNWIGALLGGLRGVFREGVTAELVIGLRLISWLILD